MPSREGLIPSPHPRLSHGGVIVSSQGPIPHIPSQVLTLFLEGASSILPWPEGLSRNTAALLHQPNDLLAPTHPPGLANLSLIYGSVPACWAGSSECITFSFVRCNPTAKLQTSCWCRSHLSFPRGWHVGLPQAPLSSHFPAQCFVQSRCSGNICQVNECHQSSRMKRPTRNGGTHR